MKTTFQFLFLFILCIAVVSCKKFKANKFAGTYACQVDYHYWSMIPESYDSTYREDVVVERNKRDLTVFDRTFPVDSVLDERLFNNSFPHSGFQIRFLKDSLYLMRSGGGLGGGYTLNYACSKR